MTDLLSGGRCLIVVALLAVVCVGVVTAQPSRVLILEHVDVQSDDPDTRALVLRYIPVVPGDVVDGAILSEARADLEGSGFFRDVFLYTSRGHEPGAIILHVEVEVDRKLRFLTGFGYEPLDGWYLNIIGASVRNRPRAGSEWRLALRDGYFTDGWFLEGRMGETRHGFGTRLFEVHAQRRTWFAYDQREEWRQVVQHVTLRSGREFGLSPESVLVAWLGYRGVDPGGTMSAYYEEDDQERPVSDLIDADVDEHHYLDFWLEGAWDGRDAVRSWRRGGWVGGRLHLSQELGGHWYYTLEADARRMMPLGDHAALAGRVRVAHTRAQTPYHDRFQFGGVTSVRGFDPNFLGGPRGAANLVQANLEYRLPLMGSESPTPRLTWVMFVDTGQSWARGGDSLGWVVGAGAGFRLRLPWVKLTGLEVGYPLVDVGDVSPFVVNWALGWSY